MFLTTRIKKERESENAVFIKKNMHNYKNHHFKINYQQDVLTIH